MCIYIYIMYIHPEVEYYMFKHLPIWDFFWNSPILVHESTRPRCERIFTEIPCRNTENQDPSDSKNAEHVQWICKNSSPSDLLQKHVHFQNSAESAGGNRWISVLYRWQPKKSKRFLEDYDLLDPCKSWGRNQSSAPYCKVDMIHTCEFLQQQSWLTPHASAGAGLPPSSLHRNNAKPEHVFLDLPFCK